MNTVNLFEVAGSIAGIAGISLIVFYFLFTSIIKSILPSLTRDAKKNIIVLMMFMVWSVTIIGMTTWIYTNTNNDGGQQPEIVEEQAVVEQEAGYLIPVSKAILSSASTYAANASSGRLLMSNKGTVSAEKKTYLAMNSVCSLRMKSNIWMSFNPDKPYFRTYYDGDVKVVLQKMNQGTAAFKLTLQEEGKLKIRQFELNKGKGYKFDYKGCTYEFIYTGQSSEKMGLSYWFKTRYIAHYQIQPM